MDVAPTRRRRPTTNPKSRKRGRRGTGVARCPSTSNPSLVNELYAWIASLDPRRVIPGSLLANAKTYATNQDGAAFAQAFFATREKKQHLARLNRAHSR